PGGPGRENYPMSTIKSLSRLGAVLVSLAIIAVSLASSASASTSMFPEPGSEGGTGPVTPCSGHRGPHRGRGRHAGLADRLDRGRGRARRGDCGGTGRAEPHGP